jgi:hypothetical protein
MSFTVLIQQLEMLRDEINLQVSDLEGLDPLVLVLVLGVSGLQKNPFSVASPRSGQAYAYQLCICFLVWLLIMKTVFVGSFSSSFKICRT